MKNLFKISFIGLLLTVTFFAYSSDDDNDASDNGKVVKIQSFSVKVVDASVRGKTYEYSWTGIKGAHSYQVFYRAKGSNEWDKTNYYVPDPNEPGQTMASTMMAGYGQGVVYEMKIVAYRHTTGKIIAESDMIESP